MIVKLLGMLYDEGYSFGERNSCVTLTYTYSKTRTHIICAHVMCGHQQNKWRPLIPEKLGMHSLQENWKTFAREIKTKAKALLIRGC